MKSTKLASVFSTKKIPPLGKLQKALPKNAEFFVVGGAVRDAFLSRKTKDIDIIVRNVPLRTLEKILKKSGSVELVGKTFGVFKWMPKGWQNEAIDVALPRKDHAFGTGGYKHVKTQSDPHMPIEEDLLRRDYTINALAYDLRRQQVVDTTGGLGDLKLKILKTVGDPNKRFHEDYLRMLRGIRLSVELDFNIEDRCAKILRLSMHHLQDKNKKGEWVVPRETIGRELVRTFVANPVKAFDACFYFQVFGNLIPEVMDLQGCPQPAQFHSEGDVMQHTRLAISKLQSKEFLKYFGKEKPSALLIFATLLHDIAKPVTITFPQAGSKDRIRYNNHDAIGAELASRIANRLGLSVYPRNDSFRHVSADHLAWLVRYHLVGFRNSITSMRPATIEKYYFHDVFPSKELLRLQYVDTAATVGPKRRPDYSGFEAIYKHVSELSKVRRGKGQKSLLSGTEIMKTLGIPSGPDVGKALEALRNAQLKKIIATKQEAQTYILKYFQKR